MASSLAVSANVRETLGVVRVPAIACSVARATGTSNTKDEVTSSGWFVTTNNEGLYVTPWFSIRPAWLSGTR